MMKELYRKIAELLRVFALFFFQPDIKDKP